MNLNKFLNPRAVAIIGATDDLDKVGGILFNKAFKSKCKIIPINPNHKSLSGLNCYKNLLEYDGKIDLAVIAIPSSYVLSILKQCNHKKIKNIILISAGFSEIGNKSLEDKIYLFCKKNQIRLLGPNCFGVFNSENNLDLTFAKNTPKSGNTVFISQSGALWSYLSDLNLGFDSFISLGNMADLEFSDFVDYFSKKKNVQNILLYVEKLKEGIYFINSCKKAFLKGKKIYVVKSGISKKGLEATFSHTGSLASDYQIYDSAFEKAGVISCKTIEQALEKIYKKDFLISKVKNKIKGKRFNIITNAGGAGALITDIINEKNLEIINKPIDILGTAKSRDYLLAINKIKNNLPIVLIATVQSMTDVDNIAELIVKLKEKKIIIPIFLGNSSIQNAKDRFKENKINFYTNFLDFKNSL